MKSGKWITSAEFASLEPRNVFFRQLESENLDCSEHRNRHILFRKSFVLEEMAENALLRITADDYYKLYINGTFVALGPAPSYHFCYNYNEIDVSPYLKKGENIVAVHTLYQGLINRAWQSGDLRHGLWLELLCGETMVLASDESFKCAVHSAYCEMGTVGYDTGFLEKYDSRSGHVGFERTDYDDRGWGNAHFCQFDDHILQKQRTESVVTERIDPKELKKSKNTLFVDFGSNYVGYLCVKARGKNGDKVVVRCGQELCDGGVRYNLRANCVYEEEWILSSDDSILDWFDYKSFRYAEITLPDECEIVDIFILARHYPFQLKVGLKNEYKDDERLGKIWDLCVNTQRLGTQEVIQDCMEREKGFYMGDGCYTALTRMVLTGDDAMVRKLIDDGFASSFVTDGLVTCLDCSFMQEIAEYPLMMIYLVLWHYNYTGDKGYLAKNYSKAVAVLESYRRDYERDFLLSDLDKWCVVEWPSNFRDGYAVDIAEGKVCHEAHVSINAYYIEAVKLVNKMTSILGFGHYRDESPLTKAFTKAFYVPEKRAFRDGVNTDHISLAGNVFPFAFGLCPDEECENNILSMISERGISALSFFCTFPVLAKVALMGKDFLLRSMMLDEGAWLRMLSEDATTTFEGWGKDTKWNTSLFHMTMSYGALFLCDADIKRFLEL